MALYDLANGFWYALGFCPVLVLFLGLLRLLERGSENDSRLSESEKREQESYRRGFQDGKTDQVKTEALAILDQRINEKMSHLVASRGINRVDRDAEPEAAGLT